MSLSPTSLRSPGRCLVAVVCAIAGAATSAGAQTVDFNALMVPPGQGTLYIANCYMEGQLTFKATGLACSENDAFAVFGPEEAIAYTGSSTLTMARIPSVDITAGGRAFSLFSIDLAPGGGGFGFPTTVMFRGMLAGGGEISQSVDVPGGSGFSGELASFTLSGFNNVTAVAVTASGDDPFVQLDNISASVVPEPATLMLVGIGLSALGLMARRRRRAA